MMTYFEISTKETSHICSQNCEIVNVDSQILDPRPRPFDSSGPRLIPQSRPTSAEGLLSDLPHLSLKENRWSRLSLFKKKPL